MSHKLLFSSAWIAGALLTTSCQPGQPVCLSRSPDPTYASCAAQNCVDDAQPLLVTNDYDPSSQLLCRGCEQDNPTSYRLGASSVAQVEGGSERRSQELTLELKPTWNRTISAAALNASLVQGTFTFYNTEDGTAGSDPLRATFYHITPGDIEEAKLVNGRAQIKFSGHFRAILSADRCVWSAPVPSDPSSGPVRRVQVDLPYAIYSPPPPPPPVFSVDLQASATTICRGECVTLTAQPSGGTMPAKYTWEHGLPPSAGPHRVCPSATTSYVVAALDSKPYTQGSGPQRTFDLATVVVKQDCAGTPPAPVEQASCERTITASSINPLDSAGGVQGKLVTDAHKNSWLSGEFSRRLDLGGVAFGAGDGWQYNYQPNHFLANYDANCQLRWSRLLGLNTNSVRISSLLPEPSGDMRVVGLSYGAMEPLTEKPLSSERSLSFVARLSKDGEVVSYQLLPDGVLATTAALDAQGNTLVIAHANSGIDLGGGPIVFDGPEGYLLLKLNAQAALVWSLPIHTSFDPVSVATDKSGNVYVRGQAVDSVRFGTGPVLTSSGPYHLRYIAKFSTSGALVYQQALPVLTYLDDDRKALSGVDDAGNYVLTGSWAAEYTEPDWSLQEFTISTRRFAPNGALLWHNQDVRTQGTTRDVQTLNVGADGSFLVGSANYPWSSYDDVYNRINTPALTKYNTSGVQVWERRLAAQKLQKLNSVAWSDSNQLMLLLGFGESNGNWNRLKLSRMKVP